MRGVISGVKAEVLRSAFSHDCCRWGAERSEGRAGRGDRQVARRGRGGEKKGMNVVSDGKVGRLSKSCLVSYKEEYL